MAQELAGVAGIVVPGGFGDRGAEGEVVAARFAREQLIPYLGLCRGMQQMVVEFARHVLGEGEATSTEFDPETRVPVISLLSEQEGIVDRGGTMRLGHYPCALVQGTKAAAAYGVASVEERHRHRWEFNNRYRAALEGAGLVASGMSPDGRLVEITELRDHPFHDGVAVPPGAALAAGAAAPAVRRVHAGGPGRAGDGGRLRRGDRLRGRPVLAGGARARRDRGAGVSEDEVFGLIHTLSLFLFMAGLGATMLPLYRAWNATDIERQVYAFQEAGAESSWGTAAGHHSGGRQRRDLGDRLG